MDEFMVDADWIASHIVPVVNVQVAPVQFEGLSIDDGSNTPTFPGVVMAIEWSVPSDPENLDAPRTRAICHLMPAETALAMGQAMIRSATSMMLKVARGEQPDGDLAIIPSEQWMGAGGGRDD